MLKILLLALSVISIAHAREDDKASFENNTKTFLQNRQDTQENIEEVIGKSEKILKKIEKLEVNKNINTLYNHLDIGTKFGFFTNIAIAALSSDPFIQHGALNFCRLFLFIAFLNEISQQYVDYLNTLHKR